MSERPGRPRITGMKGEMQSTRREIGLPKPLRTLKGQVTWPELGAWADFYSRGGAALPDESCCAASDNECLEGLCRPRLSRRLSI